MITTTDGSFEGMAGLVTGASAGIGEAVVWLSSDAANYAIGMAMALDGGLTLGPANPTG